MAATSRLHQEMDLSSTEKKGGKKKQWTYRIQLSKQCCLKRIVTAEAPGEKNIYGTVQTSISWKHHNVLDIKGRHVSGFPHFTSCDQVVYGFRLDIAPCLAPSISNGADPSCVEGSDTWMTTGDHVLMVYVSGLWVQPFNWFQSQFVLDHPSKKKRKYVSQATKWCSIGL